MLYLTTALFCFMREKKIGDYDILQIRRNRWRQMEK